MNAAFLLVAVAATLLSTSVPTEGVFTKYTCNNNTDCTSVMSGSACYKISGCQQGTCMCTSGRQNNDNQCVTPTILLQNACMQDSDCLYPTATCTAGVCSCNGNGAPSGANTVCSTIALGSACSTSTQGCGLFASCLGNTTTLCQCVPGYEPTNDGVNCAPYAQNDACDGTSQCGYPPSGYGYCDATGHRVCNATYSKWQEGLYMNVNIGGCVPLTAQTGVAMGQACTLIDNYLTPNPPIQICGDNLVCAACPEDPNTPKCQGTAYSSTTTAAPSNTTTVRNGALANHMISSLTSVTALVTVVMAVIM